MRRTFCVSDRARNAQTAALAGRLTGVRPVALALALLLCSCTAGTATPTPTSPAALPTLTATPTLSPIPTPPVYWPLRGTLAPSAEAIARRPLLVRIPNDVGARPQAGLARADMVWELLAEGGITRYMAVFHSEEVDQIGPIRSARLSDLHLAPMLRGILAHVGASAPVLARVRAAAARGEFVDVDQFNYPAYYTRVSFRSPPQNVYTSTQRLREAARMAGDSGNVAVPALEFLQGSIGGAPSSSPDAGRFTIPYLGAMRVTYSLGQGGYSRTQGGVTTIDASTGAPVLADSVVVIFTDITPQPGIVDQKGSPSLDIRSSGTGPVSMFVRGTRIDGTWSRQGTEMYRFAEADGRPLRLMPGRTWVHVVPKDWVVDGRDP